MPWNDDLEGPVLEIASSNESPLRVVAGPGTGKSFALMRRVARLIEKGVPPERILLVTFTRVSARDLERELNLLDYPAVRYVRKGTLHSLCFSILTESNVLELNNYDFQYNELDDENVSLKIIAPNNRRHKSGKIRIMESYQSIPVSIMKYRKLPAPDTIFLASVGIGIIGWLRRRAIT